MFARDQPGVSPNRSHFETDTGLSSSNLPGIV